MLNSDTLLLVHVCVTMLTTVLLVVSACYVESPQELRWWAVGNVFFSAGVVLSTFPGLPPFLSSIAGYGVIGFGMALVLQGVRVHFGETMSWVSIILIALGAALVPAYFTLSAPNLPARLSFSGFYFGVIDLVCAYTLVRLGRWRAVGIAAIGFLMLGVALFARGVHMALHGGPIDQTSSFVLGMVKLAIPLAQICICFGLILTVMLRYGERLRRMSTIDPLTGVLNRAGLEVQGKRVALRALRAARSLTVVMMDVDHFKAINDTHGHPVGDEVLRHLARLLSIELRSTDLLARFGGEEFVLVLDGVNLEDAVSLAERLRVRIESATVEADRLTVRYTASLGVACSDQHSYDLLGLISAGDAALYDAKRAGRNRVIVAQAA